MKLRTKVEYPYAELTEKIIGAAYTVHNELGGGFIEKVYENALVIELSERGIDACQQPQTSVSYRGRLVGEFNPDLIVEDKILVEVKAVRTLTHEYDQKLIHYLKATGLQVGLLINFGESVQVRRKIFTLKLNRSASESVKSA